MMQTVALAIALYGAALSTVLAVLRHRALRPRVAIFPQLQHVGNGPELVLFVVNPGQRPVTIAGVSFWHGEDSYGGPGPVRLPDLPHRLEDGEQMTFAFPVALVDPTVEAFEIRDTRRRTYRHSLSLEFAEEIRLFKELPGRASSDSETGDGPPRFDR